MKFLYSISFLVSFVAFSQKENPPVVFTESDGLPERRLVMKDTTIYEFPDTLAQFPGGVMKILVFINENFGYLDIAREERISCTTYIGFVIEKDGTISNIKVIKGISKAVNEECIKVMKKMPKWAPAKNKGKIVRCKYTLPFRVIFA